MKIYNLDDDLLNGTWTAKWFAAQPRPPHQINHVTPHLECTCGYRPLDMHDWSLHVVRRLGQNSGETLPGGDHRNEGEELRVELSPIEDGEDEGWREYTLRDNV